MTREAAPTGTLSPTTSLAAPRDEVPSGQLIRFVVWTALLVGAFDCLYWVQRAYRWPMIFYGRHVFWIGPAAELLLIGLPSLAAFGALSLAGRRPATVAATFVCLFLAWVDVISTLFDGLHWTADALLAAGLAAQATRMMLGRAAVFGRFVRRTLPGIVALELLWTASVVGWFAVRDGRAEVAAAAPDRDAPNVLLVVLDTVRADAFFPNRNERSGPLAELGRSGVSFDHAISTAPWTLPSHATMMTGAHPHEIGVGPWYAALGPTPRTLAEWFSARGYRTGGFVGNTVYCSRESGLQRGFQHYDDYQLTWESLPNSTQLGRTLLMSRLRNRIGWYFHPERRSAADVNAGFLEWLDETPDRPYFAFLNYFDGHEPFIPPIAGGPHYPQTAAEAILLNDWDFVECKSLEAGELETARGAYLDCIDYMERELAELIDQLDRRGRLENTLLIVTSDHGEQFCEHRRLHHRNSVYQPTIHVPLLFVWPDKLPRETRVGETTTLRDLAATIADLASEGSDAPFPGTSLRRLWDAPGDGPSDVSSPILAELSAPPQRLITGEIPKRKNPARAVFAEGFKYIVTGEKEELYDLTKDPAELVNLALDQESHEILDRMRERLKSGFEAAGSR